MALVVPLVLVSVWWTVRRIRHRLIRSPDGELGACSEPQGR
jgi:uncharacterized membrane-anchored protein